MLRVMVFIVGLVATSAFAAAGKAPPLVDAGWLHAHLQDETLVVLDIRSAIDNGGDRSGFNQAHIPGAVYSNYATDGWRETREGVQGLLPPVRNVERLIGGLGIGNSHTVVIVPAGTGPTDFGSAARVYWTFRVLGHDQVSILNGGFAGWQAAGYDVASGDGGQRPVASFQGELQEHLIATLAEVEQARTEQAQLVDARPEDYFGGETRSPAAKAPGTLPGALNLPHHTLLSEQNQAWYLDVAHLTERINEAELNRDAETIAFCNTGHWAATDWFVLSEVAGFDRVALYDGSMAEWSQDSSRPMQVAKRGLGKLLDIFN
ncbi:sulfurtransferase [Marinobacter sp. X15-166B]|uniref:sulfurtransferase n=1 Tax=Marinobacter sp. X15-166B TaxID=1897620 RepID=UPI00085C9DD7|nr:sulfurtransferase [Marinobacter sp. X15-166B]OEY66364.1 sulfurtransferase [Marinobacter sp. X15-166B]